ncbi:glycosyltransferase family 76 protein, partial [Cystobasidium minutum MCA 4210]|uniref:glycosyltransferase family 76 protein n=1 Tax=Cystobasidium minutum MCA 4210 TaxID=1397322 RepID=UPI0034CEFAF3
FTQWDTIHFLAIARHGYADEQKFAFLPGAPGLLAVAERLPRWMGISDGEYSAAGAVLLVSSIATCLSCFTPVMLYRLSIHLVHSKAFARTTAILYIISPAPAIFSVPYTEPFYAFFAFSGMLYLVKSPKQYFRGTICFTIAAVFRANGILNIGFVAWSLLWHAKPSKLFKNLLYFGLLSALIAAPFAAHQVYAYKTFCNIHSDRRRPWCERSLPLVYSYVQEHYWNVGFLRYWTLQQLPNFLLAAPVLAISLRASYKYYSTTWPDCFYSSLPLIDANSDRQPATIEHTFFNIELLPFVHLHTILTFLLIFASHVQIALRQACTNPVIYWYAAYLVESRSKSARWWTGYCIVWGAVSIVLWTAFYPPA